MRSVFILTAVILFSGCSDKLKEVVTPPDVVGIASSSDGVSVSSSTTESVSSSQLAQSSMNSMQGNTSSTVNTQSSEDTSLAHSSAMASSMVAASSSAPAYASSSNGAFSSASSSAGMPPNSTDSVQLFESLCERCHQLSTQSPFQIGDNLSLAEMTQTIEHTMPFRHSENCIGSCAEELAYYITESLTAINTTKTKSLKRE